MKLLHIKLPVNEDGMFLVDEATSNRFIDDIKKTVGSEYTVITSPFRIEIVDDTDSMRYV